MNQKLLMFNKITTWVAYINILYMIIFSFILLTLVINSIIITCILMLVYIYCFYKSQNNIKFSKVTIIITIILMLLNLLTIFITYLALGNLIILLILLINNNKKLKNTTQYSELNYLKKEKKSIKNKKRGIIFGLVMLIFMLIGVIFLFINFDNLIYTFTNVKIESFADFLGYIFLYLPFLLVMYVIVASQYLFYFLLIPQLVLNIIYLILCLFNPKYKKEYTINIDNRIKQLESKNYQNVGISL